MIDMFMQCRYWAQQLAKQGLIGFIVSQSPEYVAPHGATQPIFGTNPFAVGIPTEQGPPVVLDMATSATSWFGLVEAERAGQQVADDIGYDSSGQPTTDPAAILKGGAIRVFDRCKPQCHVKLLSCCCLSALLLVSFAAVEKAFHTVMLLYLPSCSCTLHLISQHWC